MPIFNDINLDKWREETLLTDSLWLFPERAKYGKHDGFYHGNFIPQIPNQLLRRYTKKGDLIIDPFVGSGTTVFECEELKRNCIGIDIQDKMIEYVKEKINKNTFSHYSELFVGDSSSNDLFENVIVPCIKSHRKESVQFALLHPPYYNILHFSNKKEDLSNRTSINDFLEQFTNVVINVSNILERKRYLAIVVGDKYSSGEWIPLGFMCMDAVKKLGFILKGVIIKNMEGNRNKINQQDIWRYRALSSDYFIFKHEYIFIFKKP